MTQIGGAHESDRRGHMTQTRFCAPLEGLQDVYICVPPSHRFGEQLLHPDLWVSDVRWSFWCRSKPPLNGRWILRSTMLKIQASPIKIWIRP